MKKVLAVASEGGHWVQLSRLKPSFEGSNLSFLTTNVGYKEELSEPCFIVQDANLTKKLGLIIMFLQVFWVMLRLRPDVVVTTGAAPGFAALVIGKTMGAKTIWIDSIANGDELSSAGKKAGRWADVWLTQWEHLAKDNGPMFKGRVL